MILRQPATRITTGDRNRVIIRNCEVLVDTVSLAAAGAATIARKPLIPTTFSWLGGASSSYGKYRWIRLKISYIPFCGTGTSGRYAMGLVSDAGDTAPSVLSNVISLDHGVLSPVWGGGSSSVDVTVDVTKFSLKNYPWISLAGYGALSTASDRNSFCPSELFYGTDGGVAGSAGTIVADYEIELMNPIPSSLNP